MKRYGNLFHKVYDFDNLRKAYLQARKNKRYHYDVLKFTADLEDNLLDIQEDLQWTMYKQGPYHHFHVTVPKLRFISAPKFRDRVMHHALINVVEPILDKRFYEHSYACRAGRGTHKAAATLQRWIRNLSFEGKKVYALKCDISKYFASIDHLVLKRVLARVFKDPDILWLFDVIIDSKEGGVGIPIGNLSSQLLANVYLNELDQFMKNDLHVKHHIRYMDDFVIISNDKDYLKNLVLEIEAFVTHELRLTLNPKTAIMSAACGIEFVGYRIYKDHKKVRKSVVRRMRHALTAYSKGKITDNSMTRILPSWLGHIQHADSFKLQQEVKQAIEEQKAQNTA